MSTPAVRAALLTGEAEALYVDRLVRIIRAARLNLHYPDGRAMQAHLDALSPAVHGGLYEGVEVNLASGLPTYREWTRVQTDVLIADEQLAQLGPRAQLAAKAQGRDPGSIQVKQLKKHDYYSKLRRRPLVALGDMSVALRRVDPAQHTAWFHVVLDKLDANGLFVRYAIDLAQRSGAWNRPIVTLDAEVAQHTEEFQSLIYKFTSLDAEFTHAKLSSIAGITVERVSKGCVGPLYFTPEQAPPGLRALLSGHDGAFLAMCALDMVADDIAEDRDNDPLDDFFAEKLSPEARAQYVEARAQMAHKCFKDRKFIVPRALVRSVQAWCESQGTRNIVYGI